MQADTKRSPKSCQSVAGLSKRRQNHVTPYKSRVPEISKDLPNPLFLSEIDFNH
jgi:hypothetical protein